MKFLYTRCEFYSKRRDLNDRKETNLLILLINFVFLSQKICPNKKLL